MTPTELLIIEVLGATLADDQNAHRQTLEMMKGNRDWDDYLTTAPTHIQKRATGWRPERRAPVNA